MKPELRQLFDDQLELVLAELDNAERSAEVATFYRNKVYDELAELCAHLFQLRFVEFSKISGRIDP